MDGDGPETCGEALCLSHMTMIMIIIMIHSIILAGPMTHRVRPGISIEPSATQHKTPYTSQQKHEKRVPLSGLHQQWGFVSHFEPMTQHLRQVFFLFFPISKGPGQLSQSVFRPSFPFDRMSIHFLVDRLAIIPSWSPGHHS